MTNDLPVYKINGSWKGKQVRDYPVLILQAGLPVSADIDTSMVDYIADCFQVTPSYTGLGVQFYFDLDQADVAVGVRNKLRDVGYSDADFVSSR